MMQKSTSGDFIGEATMGLEDRLESFGCLLVFRRLEQNKNGKDGGRRESHARKNE